MPLVDGVATPGKIGRAHHLGEPLTCEQIRQLDDGAEVTITWCGGNGPHPYRVLVDAEGVRRTEGLYCDPILSLDSYGFKQREPLNRVTAGWCEHGAQFAQEKSAHPEHIIERIEILRGIPQPQPSDLQLRLAGVLEDVDDALAKIPWEEWLLQPTGKLLVQREFLSVALNDVSKQQLGDQWFRKIANPVFDDTAEDRAVAALLADLDKRLFDLPWESHGGLPVVDRDLLHQPCEAAAEQLLGEHWRRFRRRARRNR